MTGIQGIRGILEEKGEGEISKGGGTEMNLEVEEEEEEEMNLEVEEEERNLEVEGETIPHSGGSLS